MNLSIRQETEKDHRNVETLTRMAFWNLYVPGCNEHYLTHILRPHPDFLQALNFVAVLDDQIVGNIMYTRSHIINGDAEKIDTVTFGPVGVLPEYQRQGIGTALIRHSTELASQMGYGFVIIHGSPGNYCKHGFKGSKTYNICNSDGKFPVSLLVLELKKDLLSGKQWKYVDSDVFNFDEAEAKKFDQQFPPMKKEYSYTQEEFKIAVNAYIQ